MENLNPDKKRLSELVTEAEKNNMTIVIIGAGETGSKVAEVIAHKRLMGVHVANLVQEDQDMIERANNRNAFEPEPIIYKARPVPEFPEIKIDYHQEDSKVFAGFKKKKRKGYQK